MLTVLVIMTEVIHYLCVICVVCERRKKNKGSQQVYIDRRISIFFFFFIFIISSWSLYVVTP